MAIYRGTGDTNAGIPQLEGDMLKSVYDTNNDGIVDHAALSDIASSLDGPANVTYVDFDTVTAVAGAVARLKWNNTEGTLDLGLKGGNVTLQLGQEEVVQVYNNTGTAFTDMQVVRITGSSGTRLTAALAQANSEATSATSLAVVTEPIANNNSGFATRGGIVNGVNTNAFNEGDALWLSPSVAGGITNVKPTAPNHLVLIGWCVKKAGGAGQIYVHIQNGYELDELHDVLITSKASGNTLIYDAVAGVWKNANLTAGTGISVTNGAGSITVANTGVTSIAGTANQVTASASTGGVTLSLPATINVNTSGNATTATTATNQSGGTINATSGVISANTSSDALRITQTGSGNALLVEDSANPDATPFVINGDGKVILGSTSVWTDGALQLNNTNAFSQLDYNRTNGGIVAADNTLGITRWSGFDGSSYVRAAQIFAAVDGTPGTNDMPGRLVFSTTADGASSPTEAMRIDSGQRVGIGPSGTVAGTNLYLTKNIAGATFAYGFREEATINSGVTVGACGLYTNLSTTAASFTLPSLYHYISTQGTVGAGSTITNQYGFFADPSLTGATNNYGFYSNLSVATGRYNFYAAGGAWNFFAANTGIAATPSATYALDVGGSVRLGKTDAAVTTFINSATNWNFSNLNLIRNASNTATPRFMGMLLDGDDGASTTIGGYNAIWGAYDSAPTTGSTSAALNGAMVYGAYAGHRWYTNGTERMRIDSAGRVGIGGTPAAGRALQIDYVTSGAINGVQVLAQGKVSSDNTNSYKVFGSYGWTQTAAFTTTSLSHYFASQGAFGAGSAVTSQYGFNVENTLISATNNYGFYSNIASGTGLWNFYAAGTADNYMAGKLGVGITPSNMLDVQSSGQCIVSSKSTGGYAAFSRNAATGNNSYDFYLRNGTEVARITVDTTGSYLISNGSGATPRFYLDSAGNVGIGSAPNTQTKVDVGGVLPSSSGLTEGVRVFGTIPSATTTNASGFITYISTEAAAFTLPSLFHFRALKNSFGAGSTVTNQYGFFATNLTGATNNFGFHSNLVSGTGQYNFYAAGSADNYFAGNIIQGNSGGRISLNGYSQTAATPTYTWGGQEAKCGIYLAADNVIGFGTAATERMRIDSAGNVGIGGVPGAGESLRVAKSLTGATGVDGIKEVGVVQSDVTSYAQYFTSVASTAAASFTLPTLKHYNAYQGTIGAGSTVTSQYGFSVDSTLTGATNNYGFYGNIASGTGRYNFYAAGSADNYFSGRVGIGATPGASLDVSGVWQNGVGIARINASSGQFSGLTLQNAASAHTYFYADSVNNITFLGATSGKSLVFATNTGGTDNERMRIDSAGNLIQSAPATAPTLSTNGTMVFNLTSNTNLRVSVRGSDGVTRTANITLA